MRHLEHIQKALGSGLAFVLDPLSGQPQIWSVALMALLTSVLALSVYRRFSSRNEMEASRDRVQSSLLEVRLFREDPVLMARAVGSLARANLTHVRLHLKPLLILFLPVAAVLACCEGRFGYRPFLPGEPILFKTFWKSAALSGEATPDIVVPPELTVETPPLRLAGRGEVDWRLSALRTGEHTFSLKSSQGFYEGTISVSSRARQVAARTRTLLFRESIVHPPSEGIAEAAAELDAVEIAYPRRSWTVLGREWDWIWIFLALTFLSGYLMKGWFGVQF
ncbi:MAG: hypothetical protein AB1640_20965 [bacterium]